MSDEDIFGDSDAENEQNNEDEHDQDINIASNKNKTENPKTKTVTRKATLKLNADRTRGIPALEGEFRQVNFNGRGHEGEDLEVVLTGLEHWTYRLFPNLCFSDCIERIEKLGAQRAVQGYMRRVRMDLQDTDSELIGNQPETVSKDAFDEFLSNYSKENFTEEVNRISTNVTQEQFERMNENKRRAEEKRKSRSLHTTNAELNLEKID